MLDEGAYAYRSSAAAEDLETASFAGQYVTVLGVVGAAAGVEAVETVRASALARAAAEYRQRAGADSDMMAVIVQRQIDPTASGVAFTRNPVTGANEVVIEAVSGIGDALLAGAVTPEEWTLASDPDLRSGGETPVLTEAQATRIADVAREVEKALGGPQDVEWAIDQDEIWLLQARPITALPLEPSARPNPDTAWERSDAFFPQPVTPLFYTSWLPVHTAVTGEAFALLGVPSLGMAHGYFYGRVYDRIIPMVGGESDARRLPPVPILKAVTRVHPGFRERMKIAAAAARDDLPIRFIEEWERGGRDRIRARTRELKSVDLAALTDGELAEHLAAVRAHTRDCGLEHFKLMFGGWILLGQMGMLADELAGWSVDRLIDLVQGHSHATRTEGDALAAVGEAVAADPEARSLVDAGTDLRVHQGAAGDAFRAYLDEFGHRCHDSFTRPTWAEEPAPVLALIRSRLERNVEVAEAARANSETAVAELLARVADPGDRVRLEEAVRRAQRGRPYGDETERDPLEAAGLIRALAMEAGVRMVNDGRLDARDDVVFLEMDELASALEGGAVDGAVIDRRRAEHRWALANEAPRYMGPTPARIGDPKLFPKSARPTAGAFIWAVGRLFFAPPTEPAEGGSLRGLGASAGLVEGTARIVRGHQDFGRIRHGDIVVCPSTMASWSSIFAVIGGLVTEVGGPLSHPGTLAREFGLPAVLGVAGATSLIEEGRRVRIDGAQGIVAVLD